MVALSVYDTARLAANADEVVRIALDPSHTERVQVLCAMFTSLIMSNEDARLVLGGVGLVKGLAALLKTLCEATCHEANDQLCQAGEALVSLLGLLLRADQNAAILHVPAPAQLHTCALTYARA